MDYLKENLHFSIQDVKFMCKLIDVETILKEKHGLFHIWTNHGVVDLYMREIFQEKRASPFIHKWIKHKSFTRVKNLIRA